MSSRNYTLYLFIITALVLLTFGVLHYLQVPAGTLIDWVVGIVAFWWLIGITTIPWNMYFSAKEVLDEAKLSTAKGINISNANLGYARKVASRFVWVAIVLHVVSALILFCLAYYKISVIGYLAAAIALLLTIVRPTQRLYEHVSLKLRQLSHDIKYPRDDVAELSRKIAKMEEELVRLNEFTDLKQPESWVSKVTFNLNRMREDITYTASSLEKLEAGNKAEHEQLNNKTADEISRLSEDARFLNHVREVIQFFKKA